MSAKEEKQGIIIPDDYKEVAEIQTIQTLLYRLFFEFHDICNKHDLTYNIFGGTLLGAVRHQGMIPWDDDIDVGMPRPDYEKFIDLFRNNKDDRYYLFCYPEKGYIYPFAKFCFRDTILLENVRPEYSAIKLFIDVFPIDGYPVDKADSYFRTFSSLKKGLCQCVYPVEPSPKKIRKIAYPIKLIKSAFYRLHDPDYYIKQEIQLAKTYSYEESEYVFCMGTGWEQKGKLLKSMYIDRCLYRFGKGYAWGISEYDEHLKKIYGDYMCLPPKEQQIAKHDYQLYVQNDLLKEIMKNEET